MKKTLLILFSSSILFCKAQTPIISDSTFKSVNEINLRLNKISKKEDHTSSNIDRAKICMVMAGMGLIGSGVVGLINANEAQPDKSSMNSAISSNTAATNSLNSQLSSGAISQDQYSIEKSMADSRMSKSINDYNDSVDEFQATQKRRGATQGAMLIFSGLTFSIGIAIAIR